MLAAIRKPSAAIASKVSGKRMSFHRNSDGDHTARDHIVRGIFGAVFQFAVATVQLEVAVLPFNLAKNHTGSHIPPDASFSALQLSRWYGAHPAAVWGTGPLRPVRAALGPCRATEQFASGNVAVKSSVTPALLRQTPWPLLITSKHG